MGNNRMDLAALQAELATDPLTRGYSGMTDAEAAASLNTVNRTRTYPSLTGDQVFTATDATEFAALTDQKQLLWVSFTSKDSIDPADATNVAFVNWIFGAGSDTLSALATLRTEDVSRAVELGLGTVKTGHVGMARA